MLLLLLLYNTDCDYDDVGDDDDDDPDADDDVDDDGDDDDDDDDVNDNPLRCSGVKMLTKSFNSRSARENPRRASIAFRFLSGKNGPSY